MSHDKRTIQWTLVVFLLHKYNQFVQLQHNLPKLVTHGIDQNGQLKEVVNLGGFTVRGSAIVSNNRELFVE